MIDRSLGIWLMAIFGVSGLAVVVLAWALPTLQSERLLATVVGLGGIGFAGLRGLLLKREAGRESRELVTDIHVDNEE